MEDEPIKFTDKKVDESWKDQIWQEKEGSRRKDEPSQKETSKEPVSFISFVNSIALQALMCLGGMESEKPEESVPKDLLQAEQLIDLLVMLKAKTKGNLDDSELKMLDAVIADLQLRFVESIKSEN